MLQARPLYDNDADAQYFIEPRAIEPIRRAVEGGLNVIVTGSRGGGKTTLLRQLQLRLRRDHNVVFVDATAVGEPLELATRIRDAISGRPSVLQDDLDAFRPIAPDRSPPPAGASRLLYAALEQIGAAPASVILVDASGSARAVHGIFGRMRDVLWQFDHTWIVAVDEHERQTALKPPADAFFDALVELPDFPPAALGELLRRRHPELDEQTEATVLAGADGNPRRALRALSNAVIHARDPAEPFAKRNALEQRASELGRPHSMLLAELFDRGQASSSDQDLQLSLGVSRGRLTQLLRELLEHDLVVAEQARPEGQGRPRTVYRPAGEYA